VRFTKNPVNGQQPEKDNLSEACRPKGRGFPERKISVSDTFPSPRLKRRGLQGNESVKCEGLPALPSFGAQIAPRKNGRTFMRFYCLDQILSVQFNIAYLLWRFLVSG
jgi:hypothetical protein